MCVVMAPACGVLSGARCDLPDCVCADCMQSAARRHHVISSADL